ncbi:hypothetical protein [Roseiflexus sp.]|uniref:hypothetical protein n=1 Tax=Roseiflexus sp. TaxID=2562120 RepID=UPI00398B4DFC
MGIFDFLFGRDRRTQQPRPVTGPTTRLSNDEQALERYRYFLRTAPPDTIEQAYADAFAQLTPEQRAYALRELMNALPPNERASTPPQDDPQTLARLATRAELREPGVVERLFNRSDAPASPQGAPAPGGMGFGGALAGTFLGALIGGVVGSMAAQAILDGFAADEMIGDMGMDELSTGFEDFGGDLSADLGGDFDMGDGW